jgi:glycosyltransferase involved in cell wall biosynthesis
VILFDLSRLVSRAGRVTPTGIDRVELAYAEHLIGRGLPLSFTVLTATGRFGLLPRAIADDYVRTIGQIWRGAAEARRDLRRTRQLARMLKLRAALQGENALVKPLRAVADRPAYLLVSHHHLEKHRAIARLKRRACASFVCLIHDLIPIEFPEYALPGQDDKHRRRIESAAALADAVIVNSAVTRDAFLPYLERAGRNPPVLVVPFGVDWPRPDEQELPGVKQPYFVCIGTIEARKNHLLLLNVWRQLAAELGEATPALVLIGQRGWETESAIDMLERSPALRRLVFERSNLRDAEMIRLLKGAQALLLPSFAEGFGFPLIEALAQRVPVLCSDLAALRENGGDIPEYLDPLDGLGWRAAVIDYSEPGSPRRAAQLKRMSGWRAPSWEGHFAEVEALIAEARAAGQTSSDKAEPVRRSGEPPLDPHPTAD